jgi:hypothetical protein
VQGAHAPLGIGDAEVSPAETVAVEHRGMFEPLRDHRHVGHRRAVRIAQQHRELAVGRQRNLVLAQRGLVGGDVDLGELAVEARAEVQVPLHRQLGDRERRAPVGVSGGALAKPREPRLDIMREPPRLGRLQHRRVGLGADREHARGHRLACRRPHAQAQRRRSFGQLRALWRRGYGSVGRESGGVGGDFGGRRGLRRALAERYVGPLQPPDPERHEDPDRERPRSECHGGGNDARGGGSPRSRESPTPPRLDSQCASATTIAPSDPCA